MSTKVEVKVCNINSNNTFLRLKLVNVLFCKQNRGPLHQNPIVKSWCLPFPGSDRSVVMRSQRYFYEKEKKRPVQMSAYVQCSSLFAAVLMILTATVFGILASFKLGRSLLEKVIGFNKGEFNVCITFCCLNSTRNCSHSAHLTTKVQLRKKWMERHLFLL